ncbi:MAG: tetratricopeptide repeat protein [Acidobacteriota bacterium]
MRPKTLLSLLFVFALVWLVVSTIANNRMPVEVHLAFVRPFTLELWVVMVAAFGAGAALILLFDIAGGARRYARDWRARQAHRAHEKTEDLYLLGLDDMVNGRFGQALSRFEQVLSREPDHVNALIKRGDSLHQLQRHKEAADALQRATGLAPENLVALYSLSSVYLGSGDLDRAEEVLQRIIAFDPAATVSAQRKLRDLKIRRQDWKAADLLQGKIEERVTLPEEREVERAMWPGIRLELGRDQFSRGQPDEAMASFQSVLRRDEGFVPAYMELGRAQMELGQTEEALATWRRGYRVTGSTALLSAAENYYLKVELPEEAIGVWKQAIVLSENEAPLRYCLGKLYYRLFMLDEALRELQMIEDRVSGLPALHIYIARILESKGELQGALAKGKMVLGDVGGLMMDYACRWCQWRSSEWRDRCERCGKWNSIAIDLRAASVPEPSIRPAPTWSTP